MRQRIRIPYEPPVEETAEELTAASGARVRLFTTCCKEESVAPFRRSALAFWAALPEEVRRQTTEQEKAAT